MVSVPVSTKIMTITIVTVESSVLSVLCIEGLVRCGVKSVAIVRHGLLWLPRHTRMKQGWHVNSLVPIDMHISDSINSVVDWERPRRRRWWLHSFV